MATPYRTGSINIFDLILTDFPNVHLRTKAEISALFDKCVAMKMEYVRAHTLFINVGSSSYNLVTGVSGTTNPVISYNNAVWDLMDYAIFTAGQKGIRIQGVLFDDLGYYHGGKRTWVNYRFPGSCSPDFNVKSGDPVERAAENKFYSDAQMIRDERKFISDVLNHVNTYNGIAYKDDPVLATIELMNEGWTAQSFPQWVIDTADYVKSIAPNVIVDWGMSADGQELIPELLQAKSIGMFGTHPYSTFGAADVTRMARVAATYGKAFYVGEYPWSKASGPAIEAAVLAEPNAFSAATWSLHAAGDNHNGGPDSGKYGTDDASFYYPGTNAIENAAVTRIVKFSGDLATIPAPLAGSGSGASTTAPSDYNSTFDGDGPIDIAKFTVYPTTGASAVKAGGVMVMTTGALGGYGDRAIVQSRVPNSTRQTLKLDVTPSTKDDAFFSLITQAATSGALLNSGDRMGVEINADGFASVYVVSNATKTLLSPGKAIPGWGANVKAYIEFGTDGPGYEFRAWTTGARPTTATATGTNGLNKLGSMGLCLNGGTAAASRSWKVDNLLVNTL